MAQSAERRQLEALYRHRFGDFLRIASSIAGDEAAAQDAVQDAFAHALRSLHRFRGEGPLEAWVWRIVLNAARDRRRRRGPELAPDHAEIAAPEPHQRAESEFASWIAELPERQRLAVFLRYRADLDYRSIALALGVEIGTVSATLHAAHETLKRVLEEVPR